MVNRNEVPHYIKKYFSEVDDKHEVDPANLDEVVEEATETVAQSSGSREFAEIFRSNFQMRLFSATVEAEDNGGGEVDIDEAAEDAVEETVAQSAYLFDDYDTYMFADEEDDDEDEVTDEEVETIMESLYQDGFNDAMRYFSELEDEEDEDEDEVEETVAQSFYEYYPSKVVRVFSETWERAFSEAKEEGASDKEAAAEATEEASLVSGIAEPAEDNSEEVAETKVQSLLEGNRYFSAFIRTYAEAKEAGASDEDAVIEASKDALDEAGVDSEVEVEGDEETKAQSYYNRYYSDIVGEEFDDEDPSLIGITGAEALADTIEAEEEAGTRLESAVDSLILGPAQIINQHYDTRLIENLL